MKEIQTTLGEYFKDPGDKWPALVADGIFGARTEKAVKSFQSREGLPITGKVDQVTLEKIRGILAPYREEIKQLVKRGDKGPLVQYIQAKLGLWYMNPGDVNPAITPDGKFGPATEKAVKDFQDEMNLPVTGTVDEDTLDHLHGVLFPRHVPVPIVD